MITKENVENLHQKITALLQLLGKTSIANLAPLIEQFQITDFPNLPAETLSLDKFFPLPDEDSLPNVRSKNELGARIEQPQPEQLFAQIIEVYLLWLQFNYENANNLRQRLTNIFILINQLLVRKIENQSLLLSKFIFFISHVINSFQDPLIMAIDAPVVVGTYSSPSRPSRKQITVAQFVALKMDRIAPTYYSAFHEAYLKSCITNPAQFFFTTEAIPVDHGDWYPYEYLWRKTLREFLTDAEDYCFNNRPIPAATLAKMRVPLMIPRFTTQQNETLKESSETKQRQVLGGVTYATLCRTFSPEHLFAAINAFKNELRLKGFYDPSVRTFLAEQFHQGGILKIANSLIDFQIEKTTKESDNYFLLTEKNKKVNITSTDTFSFNVNIDSFLLFVNQRNFQPQSEDKDNTTCWKLTVKYTLTTQGNPAEDPIYYRNIDVPQCYLFCKNLHYEITAPQYQDPSAPNLNCLFKEFILSRLPSFIPKTVDIPTAPLEYSTTPPSSPSRNSVRSRSPTGSIASVMSLLPPDTWR